MPDAARLASLGCGNPTAIAGLQPGQRVLDLGSGGGLDVFLAARQVGPTGFAYGLDMTDEMLHWPGPTSAPPEWHNAEFRKGEIEAIPLPDAAVDVVISNCVINLSTDKPAVFREAHRVLVPGGRFAVSDVVALHPLSDEERADLASWAGCLAGALTAEEYLAGLAAAGFKDATVTPTHAVRADGRQRPHHRHRLRQSPPVPSRPPLLPAPSIIRLPCPATRSGWRRPGGRCASPAPTRCSSPSRVGPSATWWSTT